MRLTYMHIMVITYRLCLHTALQQLHRYRNIPARDSSMHNAVSRHLSDHDMICRDLQHGQADLRIYKSLKMRQNTGQV